MHGRRFGPYELVRRLGEGGMGVVYEARDTRDGRALALKVLSGERAASALASARFEREARSSARLDHPNICAVHEHGSIGGVAYIAMELIGGKGVSDLIAEANGGLPWRKACAIARDVALALEHAHERGVLHRDIKPSNVLVDAEGCAKVVDFGLARDEDEAERLTRTGALLGTPAYMAPERFDRSIAKQVGASADIYALGITLYEMLAGRPPYDGESIYDILKLVRGGRPPPLEQPPGAPPGLAALTLELIARDPAGRPATAGEAARALDALLGGRARARRSWIRAHPVAFVLACAVAPVVPAIFVLGPRRSAAPMALDTAPVATPAAPAEDAVADARRHFLTADLYGARDRYDRALGLDPSNEDALCERAAIATFVEDLDAVLAERPKLEAHARNPVAKVLLATGAIHLGIVEDPGPASPAERAHPLAALLLLVRAWGQAPEDVIATCRQALALQPRSALVATFLAGVLVSHDRAAEALALLDEDRVYEGVGVDVRAIARGLACEKLGRTTEAHAALATVKAPPGQAAVARSRLARYALEDGDAGAAVAAYGGHEPAGLTDRLDLCIALYFLGKEVEARAAADRGIDWAEELGEKGAWARALGAGRAVLDRMRPSKAEEVPPGLARLRAFRGRMSARAGDVGTALADHAKLGGFPHEGESVAAAIDIARGSYTGAIDKLIPVLKDATEVLPPDVAVDFVTALEGTGQDSAARDAWKRMLEADKLVAALAEKRLASLEVRARDPGEAVLLELGPDERAMTGGRDGQGPRLFTSSTWIEGQDTIYGYAPVIYVPECAAGRMLEVEADCEEEIGLEVWRGALVWSDHAWWSTGHEQVTWAKHDRSPRVRWKAEPGTYTIFFGRFLPKGAPIAPVVLDRVKVTLRGPSR